MTSTTWMGIAIFLTLLPSSFALLWMGVNSQRGTFKRNRFIGIRSGELMASDEAWEIGHRASAKMFIICGAVDLACAFVVLFAVIFRSELIWPAIIAMGVCIAVATLWGATRAIAAVEEHRGDDGRAHG